MANPDIRSADEVITHNNLMGWGDGVSPISQHILRERQGRERLENDMPIACKAGPFIEPIPLVLAAWNSFQQSKGRFPGSYDWTLLDEFVLKVPLRWMPQLIGSCVVSNTFRGWVIRNMYQIALLGLPFEYLGRNEFGAMNYAFYCPFTYGSARRRGNMRGGDGLYMEAMQESLLKDGVISCNTPALSTLLQQLGVAKERDYPEPQNENIYRRFGDWQYLDQLKQYADYTLEECVDIKSVEDLDNALKDCKPVFHCSGIAVRKVGTHKDGFPIHARDPYNSWSHNMAYHGKLVASNGEEFYRLSNESWPDNPVYNIPKNEAADWFRNRNVSAASIGMIRAAKSTPPLLP